MNNNRWTSLNVVRNPYEQMFKDYQKAREELSKIIAYQKRGRVQVDEFGRMLQIAIQEEAEELETDLITFRKKLIYLADIDHEQTWSSFN